MHRFFVNRLAESGIVSLSPEDSRHAATVLRLSAGDVVELFNGSGRLAAGNIAQCSKGQVSVEITQSFQQSTVAEHRLDMIVALPKGDRQRVLVDMLVQLGATSLTPLQCKRSVAQPTRQAIERLQRAVIESCKQSGRNVLMSVRPPVVLESIDVLAADYVSEESQEEGDAAPTTRNLLRLFAHPHEIPKVQSKGLFSLFEQLSSGSPSMIQAVVGPEGGLDASECDWLDTHGWRQVRLGENILRVETAAVMIAATWDAWQCSQLKVHQKEKGEGEIR